MGLVRCGPNLPEEQSPSERDGLALQLVGGTWSDGSGRLGLALLATFRDEQGRGPLEAWSGRLSDSQGSLTQSFRYESTGEVGSHAVWWWSEVGFAAGETYRLTLSRAEGEEVVASIQASDSQGLPVPEVELSLDGTRLTWGPVPGAASYGCQVYSGGSLQLSTLGSATECDVSALPAGTYVAAVLAFSASFEALSADVSQRPPLPEAFHVSEGRLAFAKGQEPGATLQASAAGGALHYGRTQPGLALWVSLTRPDGTALEEAGEVELVGPGLSAEAPLRFLYPAGTRRHLVWSYDTAPLAGRYALTARVGGQLLSTTFSIGELASLEAPMDVLAAAASSGGASVTWQSVAGARAYYVSVWDVAQGALVTGLWTSGSEATFSPGTFVPGRSYDVYVAATDVDFLAAGTPARVTVSENTYLPANFIAQ